MYPYLLFFILMFLHLNILKPFSRFKFDFASHMHSDFWTPRYIFCFSLWLYFYVRWNEKGKCSAPRINHRLWHLVLLPVAMTALRFKGIFCHLNAMFKEKKNPKAVQKALFIKKFWSLIQLEMATLHFLTKTGRSQNKHSLCIWWLIPFKCPENLWFSGECNVS